MSRTIQIVAVVVALTVAGPLHLLDMAPARAEDDAAASAESQLEALGLNKFGDCFALPVEAELNKHVRALGRMQDEIRDAQRRIEQAKSKIEQKEKLVLEYLQKRRQLRAQLAAGPPPQTHNRLVMMMNELADRVVMLQQSKQEEKGLRDARAELGRLTEEFTKQIDAARQVADKALAEYKQLSANTDVQAALKQYDAATEKAYSLGPTRTFGSRLRRLEMLEGMLHRESIPLRRGSGGLWYVDVVINDGPPQEMAIDTGASILSLPAEVARRAGVTLDATSRSLTLEVADGRRVQARRVDAKTVRVGQFTVENVACAVLPPEMGSPTPLLGLSFLGNFNFHLDNAEGRLVIAEVNPDARASGGSGGGGGGGSSSNDDHDSTVSSGGSADEGATAPPAGAARETASPADRTATLAALLALPKNDPDAGRRVGFQLPNGSQAEFRQSKSGPASTLRRRFGQPDRVERVTFARPGSTAEPVTWELLHWGPLRLFVDQTGTARYWSMVEE